MQLQFQHYTIKSLIRRRKTLRLPIFLCSITIAIMFMISIVYSTIQNSTYEAAKATYGSWNMAIYNTSMNTLTGLEKNALVDQIGTMTIYGEITSSYGGTSAYIGSVDDTTLSLISMEFEQGRYPKNASEIALEKEVLLELGIPNTLGTKVHLSFIDANHILHRSTFTLCGVINSYHNNYLRQGPLVSAFLSTNCTNLVEKAISINNFVSIKDHYANDAIFHEISSALQASSQNATEQWYYNTYLESSKELPVTTIFAMIAIGAILLTSTYLSFFKYYVHRFSTLLASQILNLDKKKILHIFRLESLLLFPIYGGIGCLLGIVGTLLLYHVAGYFYTSIYFYINWHFLSNTMLLTFLCLLIIMVTSRLHSYHIITREPKLHLPEMPIQLSKKKCNRFLYLMKRYIYVYKRSLLYHVVLHTMGISSLLFIAINIDYTYDCMSHLDNRDHTDYTIKQVKDIDSLSTNLSQIKQLSEVDNVSHYSYTVFDSIVLLRIDDDSLAPSENECYIMAPADMSKESIGIQDNTLLLQSETNSCSLKIKKYHRSNNPDDKNPLLSSNVTFVYCNREQYAKIISSFHATSYNYIKIGYSKNCNPNVVTSIIDRILFDVNDIEVVHNNLVNSKTSTLLYTHSGVVTLLCLFTFLISLIILRNQQRASLQYLRKDLKIFWCLGMSKSCLHRYTLSLIMLWAVISLPIALLLTFCFDGYIITTYSSLSLYGLGHFLTSPAIILLILLFLLIYFLIYYTCLHHDINQMLKNFYNLT